MAFRFVHDRLEKYLGPDDLETIFAFEAPKDRGRFTVEEIEVRKIDGDGISVLAFDAFRDAAEKLGIFLKHFAVDAKGRHPAFCVVDLSDLSWHFLRLDAETR